jgi:hypothetical protein
MLALLDTRSTTVPSADGSLSARVSDLAPYVFIGPGELHWIGQPCRIIRSSGATREVVLACGCQGQVSRTTLGRR